MTVLSRIKKVVKWLIGEGYANTQKEVGRLLGYANESAFSQVINGHTDLPADFLSRLCALDDRINILWVEHGEGPMLKASATAQVEPAPASPAGAQPDMVTIPREVWEVIRNQAASLQEKDALLREKTEMLKEKTEMLKETAESFGRRDRQIDELIALLREEIERGDGAADLYRAASQAAAD